MRSRRTLAVVICDTRAPRQLTGSEYDERRAQCEAGAAHFAGCDPDVRALRDVPLELFEAHEAELDPVVARRCRFIIEENERVLRPGRGRCPAATARCSAALRRLLGGRHRLFEIGAPSMEAMHDAMTGAPGSSPGARPVPGFGGCLVAIVDRWIGRGLRGARRAASTTAPRASSPASSASRPRPGACRLEVG